MATAAREDGAAALTLELAGNGGTPALWPHAFSFRLDVIVGGKLELRFTAENRSGEPAPFAFAFHSYFVVRAM